VVSLVSSNGGNAINIRSGQYINWLWIKPGSNLFNPSEIETLEFTATGSGTMYVYGTDSSGRTIGTVLRVSYQGGNTAPMSLLSPNGAASGIVFQINSYSNFLLDNIVLKARAVPFGNAVYIQPPDETLVSITPNDRMFLLALV